MKAWEISLLHPEYPCVNVWSPVEVPPSQAHRQALLQKFADKLIVNADLTRALVSFQANKQARFYRWFKYKEAFSDEFVRYILRKVTIDGHTPRRLLHPFAGAGTAVITAAELGWEATAIELLPVGVATMRARLAADQVDIPSFRYHLARLEAWTLDEILHSSDYRFPHLRITEKAFPEQTERSLASYRGFLDTIPDETARYLFWFAGLAILEEVSYTRKDGQFLRWDVRSGRPLKSRFMKENILDFKPALIQKLKLMLNDIQHIEKGGLSGKIRVVHGSCLDELPRLPDNYFGLIMTSPPYCNRYDYTRTYVLELAYMGLGEREVRELRQALITSTVENRLKTSQLRQAYLQRNQSDRYETALRVFQEQAALQEVLFLLRRARDNGELNNNNVPDMIERYFLEMSLVIHELSRVLAPGGYLIMVNDNVRYHGEEILVDLILSDFAIQAGLSVERIWVLTRGKGNSSQQMGMFGRAELRKCVYVWAKSR